MTPAEFVERGAALLEQALMIAEAYADQPGDMGHVADVRDGLRVMAAACGRCLYEEDSALVVEDRAPALAHALGKVRTARALLTKEDGRPGARRRLLLRTGAELAEAALIKLGAAVDAQGNPRLGTPDPAPVTFNTVRTQAEEDPVAALRFEAAGGIAAQHAMQARRRCRDYAAIHFPEIGRLRRLAEAAERKVPLHEVAAYTAWVFASADDEVRAFAGLPPGGDAGRN